MSVAHERYVEWKRLRNAAPLHLDPRTTALVIVDMQAYFLDPASPFSRSSEASVPGVLQYLQERGRGVVEPALRRLLEGFRAHGLRVIYTTVTSDLPGGEDLMPIFRQGNARARARVGQPFIPPRGDPWARIAPGLEPRAGELQINKTTYGTFTSTGLDRVLRNLSIETLAIGGVVTNVCVETTARDAADHGYQVVLVDDACAANSPEAHEASLLAFMGTFGWVRTSDEILATLGRALPERERSSVAAVAAAAGSQSDAASKASMLHDAGQGERGTARGWWGGGGEERQPALPPTLD